MTIGSNAIQAFSLGVSQPEASAKKTQDPKIDKAASDFEALFVAQMLRSAREAGAVNQDDQSGSAMMEMAEDQMAQALSAGGGLGLARTIAASLQTPSTPLPDRHGWKMATAPAKDD